MNMFHVAPLCVALLLCSLHVEARESKAQKFDEKSASAQARTEAKRVSDRAKSDMQSILQQHLIGPNINGAVNLEESSSGSGKRGSLMSFRFGSKEGDDKKSKLQTVGSVIGDIIGVLVSEIARFFGSVVSDVAREVTAHGFVNIFKQIGDITGLAASPGASTNAALNPVRH